MIDKKIVIVDYDVGNVRSVENAIKEVSEYEVLISSDPDDIRAADGLILPGVGAFGDAMASLERTNLIPVLKDKVLEQKTPLLAICVGMQILFESSEEGNVDGLGWLPGKVQKFDVPSDFSVPHLGWNNISILNDQWLFADMEVDKNFYFAHSYHAETNASLVVATCEYGVTFPAVVRDRNIVGIQCHPEKSHRVGLTFLRNFISQFDVIGGAVHA